MRLPEFFALPVGTRLRWEEMDVDGEVIERRPNWVRIRWSDGEVLDVASDEDDLSEFVGSVELAEDADADEPIIWHNRA